MTPATGSKSCSFCEKGSKEVKQLIQGSNAFICDECVTVCSDLINNAVKPEATSSLTPRNIKEFLDGYVIGQDKAKKVISVAVSTHYKRIGNTNKDIHLDKNNLLLIGPSGSGKTHFARAIAKMLDVPFTIADATSLTEAGYVGDDVESIITRLVQAAGGDIKKAERGIIYLDEIDKKTKKSEGTSVTRDVSGEGVQQALLKIIEGSEVRVPAQGGRKNPSHEMITVDTSSIMFIVGGAFVGLEKIIEARVDNHSVGIGFAAKVRTKDMDYNGSLLPQVQTEDLVKYGLIPELVGRLPVITYLDELTVPELTLVLTEPKDAIIKQYQHLFAIDGVDLIFDYDAITAIAQIAFDRKVGARGLRSVIEQKLMELQYDLPDLYDSGVRSIILNREFIIGNYEPMLVFENKAI